MLDTSPSMTPVAPTDARSIIPAICRISVIPRGKPWNPEVPGGAPKLGIWPDVVPRCSAATALATPPPFARVASSPSPAPCEGGTPACICSIVGMKWVLFDVWPFGPKAFDPRPGCARCMMSFGSGADGDRPARRFRYRRYFCRCEATFSRVMPSTFMSCKIVLGTAFLIPRWFTAFMNRMCSSGVHTSRGFLCARVVAAAAGLEPSFSRACFFVALACGFVSFPVPGDTL
mmetsp:Transcript_13932/g.46146  ORF Transcript_13932/g.46146 Transcript_13932/m.46146 type:complete len:231 (+) Transcript_13932:1865-2557(+)